MMRTAGSAVQSGGPRTSRRPAAARTAAASCLLALIAALAGCTQHAAAAVPIQIGTAYVTLPAAAGTTRAYLVIQNNGSADRVTSARTSVGGLVTFRGPAGQGGSTTRAVPDIVIPARATVRLDPDGYHMLITGARRMRAGTEITLTLVFARAGRMSVGAMVTNPETGGSSYLGD
jgi:copper(I)-binding protein